MEMLTIISVVCMIMWYVIDRFKPIWESFKWGKYVTTVVAAVFAFCMAFGYKLDIMVALKIVSEVTPQGMILTAVLMMTGSSAVAEIMTRVKGDK